ncbi:ATP-binding protein, partial [Fictibacillus phosphorivorans]|uniref:ATP-binding protein n=1 Tax=Fictibacillus phosphorivorans TaxID=1221500 RepID=UPI000A9CCDED
MSKAIIEYKRFLAGYQDQFNEYEKKIASLILSQFDKVESATSARGNRAKIIVELLHKTGDSVVDIMSESLENETSTQDILYLSNLTVENFRGFTSELKFNLNSTYTFIYGPNGTGKSSLCEALEYSLLGTIYEADNKRININQYIQNAHTKQGQSPTLLGIDTYGKEIVVMPSLSDYEFCFIERNRIEGFARVSANTPQNQQQRLSTLFGLENFNKFVSNFNDKIESYFDCVGKKGQELTSLEKKIEGFKRELAAIPNKKEEQEKRIKGSRQENADLQR